MTKLTIGQDVIVLNIYSAKDDARIDVPAKIFKYNESGRYKDHYTVNINGTLVEYPVDKLIDAKVYWDSKRDPNAPTYLIKDAKDEV